MAGIFSTSGAVLAKAGWGASGALSTGWTLNSEYEKWIEEAEATCVVMSRYDWIKNSGAILNSALPLIKDIVSSLAAIQAVKWSMSGYTSRIEAEDVINVLRDEALRGLQLIRDQKGVTFTK